MKQQCNQTRTSGKSAAAKQAAQGMKATPRTAGRVMWQLIGLVSPLAGVMCFAILTGVLGFLAAIAISVLGATALLVILPSLLPEATLAIAQNLPIAALPYLFVAIILCAVLRGVLHYIEQSCNHYIAFKLLAHIRDQVFAVLRKLAPAKLDGADRGNLIAILTSDIELLEVFYAHTVSPICIAAIMSGLLIAFIGQFHWALGAIALLAYLFVGVCVPLAAAAKLGNTGKQHREGFGALSGYFLDSVRGIREVMQYQCGAQRQAELARRTKMLEGTAQQMRNSSAQISCVSNGAVLGFSLLLFFVAAALHLQGVIGLEGVLIPTITIFSSFGPVIALANLGAGLSQTIASGNRVLDILAETPVVQDLTQGKDLLAQELIAQGAALEDVHFAYGAQPILQGLSLQIAPGQITGITGKSGCGKSTALKLLMRFWDAQRGSVTLAGQNIKQLNTASLRAAQGFVTQDTHLFHDSIANNLRLAKPDATNEQLIAACQKASVHDFIASLPQGYDTPVGELGSTLSGGERQRLGIARAFLHDAPLLLLDEPTSNLDSLNEAVILRALDEDTQRTTVLVSHRASTMQIAQQVYHLETNRKH